MAGEGSQKYVHFLKVGGVELEPLCAASNAPPPQGEVTALIERVTCSKCVSMLNLLLAGRLNQEALRN